MTGALRNERGIALPLTLLLLVVLIALTLPLLSIAGLEPQIARNFADAKQARFSAEAGIEWAMNTLQTTPSWSTLLVGADANTGVSLAANSALPGLPAARGTYSVRLRNDNLNGDAQITGTAPEASATIDANSTVILTSTGAINGAQKTVRVAVRRLPLPPGMFPGALAFPGNDAWVNFNGNAFGIDGRGWNTDGTPDNSCNSVYGIAVSSTLPVSSPGSNEGAVENAVAHNQADNIQGAKQDPSGPANGANTIAPVGSMTPASLQAFVNEAKKNADIVLASHAASPLSYNNVGSPCASDYNDGGCWGTASAPKVVYVKGDVDPGNTYTALSIAGHTTGYGILIVEDGDLAIHGDFAWYGPIIITGNYVGITYQGGGNQQVYGAVVVNELQTGSGATIDARLSGNVNIYYSCQAITQAAGARRLLSVRSWQEL
ncbi:MAG: hypothetical protein HYR86_12355 [Candidatus Rokubacteria bacterium]|nr:hypothetical protein [Candidatus Rokubacteria bacterium]